MKTKEINAMEIDPYQVLMAGYDARNNRWKVNGKMDMRVQPDLLYS